MRSKPLCIIVDDEESGLSALRDNIEELGMLEIEKAFLDPDKFLVQIDQLESKIIFLDMEMPIEGLAVASKLKDKLIIFVSGYVERGYKTFDVNAIDFVPKPIRQSRLKQAIERALSKFKTDNLFVSSDKASKEEIDSNSIVYIRSVAGAPRDKEIILLTGKKIIAKEINFKTLLNDLPKHFIMVNRSAIVNLNYVNKKVDFETMKIDGLSDVEAIEFVIGENFKENFFKRKPGLK